MENKVKIKRCMFCGEKGGRVRGDTIFYVVCGDVAKCAAEGPIADTEAEAIERWNAAPRRKKAKTAIYPDHPMCNCWAEPAEETSNRTIPAYTATDGYGYINPAAFETREASALVARIEAVEQQLDRRIIEVLKRDDLSFSTLEDRADVLEQNELDHASIHTRSVEFMEKQAAQIEALEKRLQEVVTRLYPTGMTDSELSDIVNKRPGITDVAARVIKWAHSPNDDGA